MGTRKIRITKIEPMSPTGMEHWKFGLRKTVFPMVFKNMGHYHVDYVFLENRQVLAQWIHSHFGEGQFLVSFWRKGYYKNPLWLRVKSVARFDLRGFKDTGQFIFTDKGIGRFSWFEIERKKLKKKNLNLL